MHITPALIDAIRTVRRCIRWATHASLVRILIGVGVRFADACHYVLHCARAVRSAT
jgi:hypothetical protein